MYCLKLLSRPSIVCRAAVSVLIPIVLFVNPALALDDCLFPFVRGDANGDGAVDIADAIRVRDTLFLSGEPFPCAQAADANRDDGVDIADMLYILNYLFQDGPDPEHPFSAPGFDYCSNAMASHELTLEDDYTSVRFIKTMRVGDLDDDGTPDIAIGIASTISQSIRVYLSSTGTSQTYWTSELPSESWFPGDLELVDIDYDGDLDLLYITTYDYVMHVRFNDDATFTEHEEIPLGLSSTAIGGQVELRVADFNDDGKPDFALGHTSPGRIRVYEHDGLTAGIPSFTEVHTETIVDGPRGLAVGDFDGDSNLDLATGATALFNRAFIMLGDGDGEFEAPSISTEGDNVRSVRAGDIDNDGKDELLAATAFGVIEIYSYDDVDGTVNEGDFDFDAFGIYDIELADVNDDGWLDLVITDDEVIAVAQNAWDGTFAEVVETETGVENAQMIQVTDLDDDGLLDVVQAGNGSFNAKIETYTSSLTEHPMCE